MWFSDFFPKLYFQMYQLNNLFSKFLYLSLILKTFVNINIPYLFITLAIYCFEMLDNCD